MSSLHQLAVGLEYLRKGHRKAFSSRAELEQWQHKRVVKFLYKTLPRSPALRQRFADLSPEQWRLLEPTGKAETMASFDSLITKPITRKVAWETAVRAEQNRTVGQIGSLSIGMSSGTSGTRGLFVVSPMERARWAGAILGRVLSGERLKKQHIALLLRANSELYETLHGGRISFRHIDILQPPSVWIADLQSYEPTILVAPPSILRYLAEAQRSGRCDLNPKKVFSTAEVLDETDHLFIKNTWTASLHQIYQATEGFIALSVDEDRLLLNEDLLVIEQEWVDRKRNLFVPIITDFLRTTQPMVRYRLDDILEETDSGEWAPYRAISRIHGRASDLLNLTTRSGEQEKVTGDLISRALITTEVPLENYEIVQRQPNELIIAVRWKTNVPDTMLSHYETLLEKSIDRWCTKSGFFTPDCTFTNYNNHADPSKKFRRIRNEIQRVTPSS